MKIDLAYYDQPFEIQKAGAIQKVPAELDDFFHLLEQQAGHVWVRDNNRSVGVCFEQPLTQENLHNRRRITTLLYAGRIVPDLIERLSDGRWSSKRLKSFLATPVVSGKTGKGKTNNGERYGRW